MNTREQNVRTWSMLCHLAALVGLILPIPFGLGLVLGPLLIWQIKKNDLPEIDAHGKEAVNFQLTILIVNIVLGAILVGIWGLGLGFGFARGHYWRNPFYMLTGGFGLGTILGLINLADLILAVIAGIKANNGETYHYPFAIRFIK